MQVLCGQCGKMTQVSNDCSADTVRCAHCNRSIDLRPQRPAVPEAPVDLRARADDGDDGFASAARKAMQQTTYLVAQCDNCGRKLQVSVRQAGKQCRCPSCGHMIRVPFPGEDDEDNVDVEETFLDDAQEEIDILSPEAVAAPSRTAPAGPTPSQRRYAKPVILAGAGLGAVVVVAILLMLAGGETSSPVTSEQEPGPAARSQTPAPPAPVVENPAPESPAQPRTPGPSSPDRVRSPQVKTISTSMGVLLPGKSRPAALGRVYCIVSAGIRAGRDPLQLNLDVERLMLEFQDGAVSAIGLLPRNDWRSGLTGEAPLELAPDGYQAVTIVFEVPEDFESGTVQIASLGSIRVESVYQLGQPDPAGSYQELPPRHLKPLLRDPVMRRIQDQAAVNLEISAASEKGLYRVKLTPVGLAGTARPVGNGVYELSLSGRAGRLDCHLRQVDAETMLLYLRESAYHQITLGRVLGSVTRNDGP